MFTVRWLRWLELFYHFLMKLGSNLQSLFLLYMRLTWGHQIFKVGMLDLKNYEFSIVEAIGGILLMIGFASRIAALSVIFTTLAILSTVHIAQRPNPCLITAFVIFIFGPGRISIDAYIKYLLSKKRP